jgi:cadmium resistance protein CadD (predicted permease)
LYVAAVAGGTLAALLAVVPDAAGGAVAAGAALASANTLLAYALVLWAEGQPLARFLGAVLGGMIGRIGLLLASVAAAVLWLRVPQVPLVVSLMGYFTLFLGVETVVVHRRTSAGAAR